MIKYLKAKGMFNGARKDDDEEESEDDDEEDDDEDEEEDDSEEEEMEQLPAPKKKQVSMSVGVVCLILAKPRILTHLSMPSDVPSLLCFYCMAIQL